MKLSGCLLCVFVRRFNSDEGVYTILTGGDIGMVVRRSSDNGKTWETDRNLKSSWPMSMLSMQNGHLSQYWYGLGARPTNKEEFCNFTTCSSKVRRYFHWPGQAPTYEQVGDKFIKFLYKARRIRSLYDSRETERFSTLKIERPDYRVVVDLKTSLQR